MKINFVRAMEYLKQSIPEEKLDAFMEWLDKLNEMIKTGDKIDAGDIVADLLDHRKFGLPQDVVEELLKHLIGDRPDADKLIAGTIEYAKRKIWRKT